MARGQGSKPERGATGDARGESTNVAGTDHWDKGLEPGADPARADSRGRRRASTGGNDPNRGQSSKSAATAANRPQ